MRNWDYELFRVMPGIISARDRASANLAMERWIEDLGEVHNPISYAKLEEADIHLRPELGWIADQALLGSNLSKTLCAIYGNRLAGKQYYVSLVPGPKNPSFDHEDAYADLKTQDTGYQLLGLYRFWNIIEYWFPYRDMLGEDWPMVLKQFVPRIAQANSSEAYQRELMALIARVHDSHANLWSSLQLRPPVGLFRLPIVVRFVENRAVVVGFTSGEAGKGTAFRVGDEILEIDGVSISKLIENWSPFYAASNEPTRLRDIGQALTNGGCVPVRVRIQREGLEPFEINATRVEKVAGDMSGSTHDRPGETFQRLSDQVAYLKLSSVKSADAGKYANAAKGTKGLIIDIRNYPSDFMIFTLGSLLVEEETVFARFTTGDTSNPGGFHWTDTVRLLPGLPHYSGKVVILVDESSQSSAEYTAMAFRSVPGAKVVGSTTAGADGNVSRIPLPGGLISMISGIGVFYPDKKPTQRVGILVDVEVRPTLAGIRAGRDEVLEEAVRQILGTQTSDAEIEKASRR